MPPEDYTGPSGPQLTDATLEALLKLGGTGQTSKIFQEVVEIEEISEKILAVKRVYNNEPQVKLLMRGNFDRMKLRWHLLDNVKTGYWKLTEHGEREANKPRWQREHNASRTWWEPGEWQGEGKVGRPKEEDGYDDILSPIPEEIDSSKKYPEGARKSIVVNSYERNRDARKKCVKHYGYKCSVCSFDFEEVYGDIGKGRIHVHHKKPLSEITDEYEVDPIKDLIPVCPNCHMMIHHDPKKPALSVEELKEILKRHT